MLRDEMAWVVKIATEIAKEECAKMVFSLHGASKPQTPKPVEVDVDGIVKQVLDKIKLIPSEPPKETPQPVAVKAKAEIPKKGKEK